MENEIYLINSENFFDLIKRNRYDELKAMFQDVKLSPWLFIDEKGFSGNIKFN